MFPAPESAMKRGTSGSSSGGQVERLSELFIKVRKNGEVLSPVAYRVK
jgi:hypothetical protein